MEDTDFVKFIVKEQDSKQISLSLSQLMILRYIVENRKIKLADVQQVAQISTEDARKCCAELDAELNVEIDYVRKHNKQIGNGVLKDLTNCERR